MHGKDEKTVLRLNRSTRTCPMCGINYFADLVRLKHGRQSTCSRACSYKLRASSRTPPFFTKSYKQI